MAMSLVQTNGVIKAATPLRRKEWYSWHTVWPFIFVYLVQAVLYFNPEMVWGRLTYLVWQKYIDFFHAASWPALFFVHSFVALFTVWSIKIKTAFLFSPVDVKVATHIKVDTHAHKGEAQVVPIVRDAKTNEMYFLFQQRKWKFDAGEKKQFLKPHFPTKLTFQEYTKKVAAGGLTKESVATSKDLFGLNKVVIHIPEFMEVFVDHALAPFFVFQMFCVLLWCLDEYWMYSVFTGVMMIVLECTVVMQRINNTKSLRAMGDIPVQDVEVTRDGKKMVVKSTDLQPLDVIQIPMNKPAPADILIVKGGCVVNEAMLTGESTPQMKECIDASDANLAMKKHARHIVFSGTEVLTSTPGAACSTTVKSATGVVLKTGFETKQGKLLRTILHSQSRVSQNSGEAFAFIAFLLCFAMAAVGYLLKRGLADPNRSRWKLALHCTQIITSVVPPELPMELSLAVNSSLMQLVKLKVFCTEPYRIPFAGKVDTCCFDKTGTLTTDEMVFAGFDACDGKGICGKLKDIAPDCERTMAGCHSLVLLEGELAGDAMEKAAVKALGFDNCPREDTFQDKEGKRAVSILTRFPFDPDLRRMSCIINSAYCPSNNEKYVVCKGSPESVADICAKNQIPDDYNQIVESYTTKGLRVIALAVKQLNCGKMELNSMKRENAEKDLKFVGFAIFQCPLKKDTIETIANLMHGSQRCCIITGDNIQTALAVGKEVGMVVSTKQLQAVVTSNTSEEILWEDVTVGAQKADPVKLNPKDVKKVVLSPEVLKKLGTSYPDPKKRLEKRSEMVKYDLAVNAEGLTSVQFAKVVADFGDYVTIWARCAPAQKEDIVTHLKANGRHVLMAGDGTNDVGGLKQAHIGVAVLNSAAVLASEKAAKEQGFSGGFKVEELPPEPGPNAGVMEKAKYEMARAKHQAQLMHKKKLEAAADPEKFEVSPMPAPISQNAGFMERARYEAAKQKHVQETAYKKKLIEAKAKGKAPEEAIAGSPGGMNPLGLPDNDFLNSSMFNADDMDGADGRSAPITKLGDASIAAPFTCKSKRMMAITDLLRLGRSTLVTTLQMYKILALNCLVSAYSMSVLHSDGVKLGDYQMVITGIILSICFLCLNFSKPLPNLSPYRPITKVFHPYMVFSILGQFAVHLYSIMSSTQLVAAVDAENVAAQRSDVDNIDFKPSLLNSIVFLMTTLMTAVTFAVNFKGEPFMQPMRQNKVFFYSLIGLTSLIFYIAAEVDPETNELLEVVKFPSDEFRSKFLELLVTDAIGAFAVEKFCLWTMTDLK